MSDTAPQNGRPIPRPSDFSRPFWEATKERKLLLQYCRDTGRYQFFGRPVSLFTGRRNLEWREASGKGKVYTFTVVHQPHTSAWNAHVPYIIGSIELDEGVRIMAHLVNCAPEAVTIGMRLRLTWSPRGEFNLPAFEPE